MCLITKQCCECPFNVYDEEYETFECDCPTGSLTVLAVDELIIPDDAPDCIKLSKCEFHPEGTWLSLTKDGRRILNKYYNRRGLDCRILVLNARQSILFDRTDVEVNPERPFRIVNPKYMGHVIIGWCIPILEGITFDNYDHFRKSYIQPPNDVDCQQTWDLAKKYLSPS